MFEQVGAFVDKVSSAATQAELRAFLTEISKELGFRHFALSHHVDLRSSSEPAIRIHNYPEEWERYYDRKQLGRSDPVHRACQMTLVGFTWSQLPKMIPLTRMDRAVLDAAARQGLGDGFTVPAHVPGEVNGSCSFANASGRRLRPEQLATAQPVGAFAFEAARRLVKRDHQKQADPARFSDRERDCLIWIARGKSDSEIATILGISPETVHQYVKQARANYDAVSRSQLVAHALFSGTISSWTSSSDNLGCPRIPKQAIVCESCGRDRIDGRQAQRKWHGRAQCDRVDGRHLEPGDRMHKDHGRL